MKFKQYLNEKKGGITLLSEEQKELLEKKCSKILKLYRKSGDTFYRGISDSGDKLFIEKKGRITSRQPRNTPKEMHLELNKYFKEKFGWPVRNGISVSNNYGQATFYGRGYVFFPINTFKYCWSEKYSDLFGENSFLSSGIPIGISSRKDRREWLNKKKTTFKKIINTYTDKDLDRVLEFYERREIMFKVGTYYLVDAYATNEWLGIDKI